MRGNHQGRFGLSLTPSLDRGKVAWLAPQYAGATFALDADGSMSGIPGATYLNGVYYNAFADAPGASVTGGAGFATAVDAAGNVVGPFAANTLPATSGGAEVWEARTNLVARSQDFGDSAWVAVGGATKAGASTISAPDGSLTAYRIDLGAGATDGVRQNISAGSATYTYSVFARTVSGTKTIRLKVWDGTSNTYSSDIAITATWSRISFTAASPISDVAISNAVGGGASSILLWGYVVEAGSVPSPYIPTTTAAATRTAIAPSITGLGSILTPPFTVYTEAYLPAIDGVDRSLLSLNDGSANNQILIARNASNQLAVTATSGGVAQTGALAATGKTGARTIKAAVFVESNGYTGAADGVSGSKVSFTLPSSLSAQMVGDNASSAARLNGQARRVIIFPGGSASQIASLTA